MGKRKRRSSADGPSLEALAGVTIAGTVGYLAVEGIMNDGQHPIHWLLTAIVAIAGYFSGQFYYRWKNGRL